MAKEIPKTKQFCVELENCGAFVIPYVASKYNRPGVPDRFVTHRLWHGWVEFKDIETKITNLQDWTIKQLRYRGCNAVILRFPNTIKIGSCIKEFDGTAMGFLEAMNLYS